jgi:hypothetical protein
VKPLVPNFWKLCVKVACGAAHTICCVNGACFSWGKCHFGQLGLGFEWANCPTPTLVEFADGMLVVSVGAGESHSFAVCEKGEIFSFGCGFHGCLGHGSEKHELRPRRVLGGVHDAKIISATGGKAHSLFLTKNGEVWSCGRGHRGQLGGGECSGSKWPILVKFPVTPTSIGGPGGDPFALKVIAARSGDTSGALCVGGHLFLWGDQGNVNPCMGPKKEPSDQLVGKSPEASKRPSADEGAQGGAATQLEQPPLHDTLAATPSIVSFPVRQEGSFVVDAALGSHHGVAIVCEAPDPTNSSDGARMESSSTTTTLFSWGKSGPWLGRTVEVSQASTVAAAATAAVATADVATGDGPSDGPSVYSRPACMSLPSREGSPLTASSGAVGDPVPSAVCCGERHTVVVTTDGSLLSCGESRLGKLGPRSAPDCRRDEDGDCSTFELRFVCGFGPSSAACSNRDSDLVGPSAPADGDQRSNFFAAFSLAGANHTAVAIRGAAELQPTSRSADR